MDEVKKVGMEVIKEMPVGAKIGCGAAVLLVAGCTYASIHFFKKLKNRRNALIDGKPVESEIK